MYNVSFSYCTAQKTPTPQPKLNDIWRPERSRAARDCNSESERCLNQVLNTPLEITLPDPNETAPCFRTSSYLKEKRKKKKS